MALHQRVQKFGFPLAVLLEKYIPDHTGDVDRLLGLYKDREELLLGVIRDIFASEESKKEEIPNIPDPQSDWENAVKAKVAKETAGEVAPPTEDAAQVEHESGKDATAQSDEEELIAVYAKYNPAKVKGVKAMLEKYKGKERTLIDAVKAKYSVNAEEEEIKDTKAAAEHDNADGTVVNYVQTLTDLFTKHNPAKIAEIPRLLKKYAGKEDQLLEAVKTKYHTDEVDLPPSRPGQDAFERFLELREHAIKNPHKAKYLVHHRCPPPTTLTVL